MDKKDIYVAEVEARRFLDRVADFKGRLKTDDEFVKYWHITGYAETGALKRASLDLTRALSRLRGNRRG